jgi:putative tricarboxylic transport membrane protein
MICRGLRRAASVASLFVALKIIAGTPPGGGQDRTARALAAVLEPKVTVVNVPGRGGGNGWDRLVSAKLRADLVAVSSPTLITNALLGEAIIDHRDLTPLPLLYTEHSVLVVRPGSDLEVPSALFEAIAGGTATVSFATALGNMNHLILAEIAGHLGAPVQALPIRVFESAPLALADVVEGNGDIAIVSAASAIVGIGDGSLTAIAVTAPGRLAGVFAEVPTCLELAVPSVRGTWRGLVGPPGLDPDDVQGWADRLATATATESWSRLLDENLWVDSYLGPADTAHFLEGEREQLSRLLERTGLMATVGDG